MPRLSGSFLLGIFAFLFLAGFTAFNRFPTRPSYTDEAQHFANIELIKSTGISKEFLLAYKCTPGPVYAVIQYFLSPFTAGDPAKMRLVNVFFLGGCIIATYLLMQRFWPACTASAAGAVVSYLFIPVTYIAAGLGLTEFCSLFFLLWSLVVLMAALKYSFALGKLALAIVAGLLLGLAISTRQPFLVIIPALFLLWYDDKSRINAGVLLTAALCSLILPGYIFSVWNGWVAPFFQDRVYAHFWMPAYGILAFGFAAIFTFILNPPWFQTFSLFSDRRLNAGFIVTIGIANFYAKGLEFLPNKALTWYLPTGMQSVLSNFFGTITIYIALLFIKNLYINLLKSHRQNGITFLYVCAFLLILSCVKNTLMFGSRYLLPALPFLILIVAPSFTEKRRYLLIRATAAVIGLVSLWYTLDA